MSKIENVQSYTEISSNLNQMFPHYTITFIGYFGVPITKICEAN